MHLPGPDLSSNQGLNTHRRLFALAAVAKPALTGTIIAGVLGGIGSIAQAYVASATIDRAFMGHQPLPDLWPTVLLLLSIIAARAAFAGLHEITAATLSRHARSHLRRRLLGHLFALGPAYTQQAQSGELAVTMTDGIESLDAYFSQYLPQLAISVVVPLSILLIVFPLDPLSGAILLLTAPLIPFFMYMIGRTAETATARQYESLGRLASHFLDGVQGLTTLKLFGQSRAHAKNIAAVSDRFRIATTKALQLSFLSAFALELLATLSTAMIAVEVGLRLLYGHLPFREALFLLILSPEFYLPLRALGLRFHAAMNGVAAARRIFQIIDSPAIPAGRVPLARNTAKAVGMPGGADLSSEIQCTGVTYRYPGRRENALEDVSLRIAPRRHVALVGASGAGKTTLTWLILGFLSPSKGWIGIRGRERVSPESPVRRPLLAWVPQTPYLFNDSIAANIRLGRPEATLGEVKRAAEQADFREFVESLSQGYDTPIGEGGIALSAGQAQRLALARAFLLDAPIIVLDEPTANLDPETEKRLTNSVEGLSRDKTVITIAHRLNTVEEADEILVLERGRIVEHGPHSELRSAQGTYARMLAATNKKGPVGPSTEAPPTPRRLEQRAPGAQSGQVAPRTGGLSTGLASGVDVPLDPRAGPVLGFLLDFLRGDWGWLTLSVMLASIAIGSSLSLMGASAWLISAAALHPSIAELEVAIVGVRFFGISRAVFRYLERLASHGTTFRLLQKIRVWLYERIESLSIARLTRFRAGDVLARAVSDVETLENLYARLISPPATATVIGTGCCLFLALGGAVQSATAAAVLFAVAGVILPLAVAVRSRLPAAKVVQYRARMLESVVDAVQGLPDLRAFGRGDDWLQQVSATDEQYAAAQQRLSWISGIHTGLTVLLANLALWTVLVFSIHSLDAGQVAGTMLAPFALVTFAAFEAFAPLPGAAQLWPAVQEAASRLQALGAFQAQDQLPCAKSSESRPSPLKHPEVGIEREPHLEVLDVTFYYPDRLEPALEGLTVDIPYGTHIGIVGPSGAGKSTLARLMLRLWEPDSGDIRLARIPMGRMHEERARAHFGYLDPNPYLFDTSIYENLRLARPGVSSAAVERAAQSARIHGRILALPKGYDTLVGEHGARLSAGERQRLGIARLLLKDAPIWILDEPTAHLDAVTEAEVLQQIFELARGRSVLLITHRLLATQGLQKIIVLEHGRAVESGSYAELSRRDGIFSRMLGFQESAIRVPI